MFTEDGEVERAIWEEEGRKWGGEVRRVMGSLQSRCDIQEGRHPREAHCFVVLMCTSEERGSAG